MTLARCVSVPAEQFLAEYYGVRHLYSPAGTVPGVADLFGPAALDALLSGGLRTSSARLVRDGRESPVPALADRGDTPGEAGYVDTDGVRRAIAAGSSLILRSVQRYHPPVRDLAHALGRTLGAPVRVNAFVTPPGATGVDLHYDVQDVFVLQIAGTKRWLLREQPLARPLPSQAWFELGPARRDRLRGRSTALADLVLSPGDALYLPRGTMHAPRTEDALSIHLTCAVSVPTRHDLLARLVAAAADDPWFREHLPPAGLEGDPDRAAGLAGEAARRLVAAAGRADVASLLWDLRREAFRDVPPAPESVLPPPAADAAPAYRLRAGARYAVDDGDGGLRVRVPGRQAALPPAAAPVLAALGRDGRVGHAALVAACGPDDGAALARLLTDLDLVAADHGGPR